MIFQILEGDLEKLPQHISKIVDDLKYIIYMMQHLKSVNCTKAPYEFFLKIDGKACHVIARPKKS